MELFDVALLIIIAGFALAGFMFGFIHTIGSLLGTILGVYLASRYYAPVAAWLIGVLGWGGNGVKVLMFVIAFILINRVIGFLFWAIDKSFNIVRVIPFVTTINRVAGLVLGALEGVITLGIIIYFIDKYPLSEKLMGMIASSEVAPHTLKVANILLPLIPQAMQVLKSSVDFVEGKLL